MCYAIWCVTMRLSISMTRGEFLSPTRRVLRRKARSPPGCNANHAWYRHVTLAMLAHAFLTICAHKHKTKKGLDMPPKDKTTQDQQ